MDYSNSKKGFRKLFIGEMLMIIGNISVTFNGKKVLWMSLITMAINVAGFLLVLSGLKDMAKDEEGYRSAQTSTIIGIVLTVISAITGAVFEGGIIGSISETILDEASAVAEFVTASKVMKTSVDVMNRLGNYDFADRIGRTLSLYRVSYIISLVLNLFTSVQADSLRLVVAAVGLVTVVAALIAQIKYYIFLKDMSNEL